jgi:hypothetical protein
MNPILASWITLTITYPPPGTSIQVHPEHIIYYGKNIVSEKKVGSIIVIPGGRFTVKETPEEIQRLIKDAEDKDVAHPQK